MSIEDLASSESRQKEMLDGIDDEELGVEISKLPKNYNFEIGKTIKIIQKYEAKMVALQFPEGLLMFACKISDIFEKFCGVETVILGDITYGACCVDDISGDILGVDLIIHYGHSCLVPIQHCRVRVFYIFVDIFFDISHLVKMIESNFKENTKLSLVSTIQFVSTLPRIKRELEGIMDIDIPRVKPLSRGEILGCTSPILEMDRNVLYVGDGRFHLESIMIHNPRLKFYAYDPYTKKLTVETYDQKKMLKNRKKSIESSFSRIMSTTASMKYSVDGDVEEGEDGEEDILSKKPYWGIIISSLGRQGNLDLFRRIENLLILKKMKYVVLLLSEIYSAKLELFPQVDVWIQIACPRLSIDWGSSFSKSILNPFEAFVALDEKVEFGYNKSTKNAEEDFYPMTYYSLESDKWSNTYIKKKSKVVNEEERKRKKRLFKERWKNKK